MFRQGQLAVHGLAILLGRNEAGFSNRGKFFLHHAVLWSSYVNGPDVGGGDIIDTRSFTFRSGAKSLREANELPKEDHSPLECVYYRENSVIESLLTINLI